MPWYVYVAWIAAGGFLANGVPHFVNGVSGRKFQSPFASPPAVGESSPVVNVVWGTINFVVAAGLLHGVGEFTCGRVADMALVGAGVLVTGAVLGWYFGKVRGTG